MRKPHLDELQRLLTRQRRLIVAVSALASMIKRGAPAGSIEVLQARLLAAELRQTHAALERLGAETSAAIGSAAAGRAASLAYLAVGRAGRLH